MTTISVSGEVMWRALRTGFVAAIAVAALGLNLQVLVLAGPFAPGSPDFNITPVGRTQNVVRWTTKRARAAGISSGDRIEYPLMRTEDRYGGFAQDGLRLAPAGKAVPYIVEHNGKRRVVTLAAERSSGDYGRGRIAILNEATVVFFLFNFNALFVVLILLGSALAFIRPSGLSVAFLLFVAQYGALMPAAYYFLPPAPYAALMVICDVLAGLGAIGFLGLALYLDPKRQIRSRRIIGVGAVLLAVIVVPVAISDVSQLMAGIRPEWPLAGWASFSALSFCYVAGIVLLLRLTASASASRNLRLLAALVAVLGAMTIFTWTLVQANSWYLANLPSVDMNRSVEVDRWTIPHWWAYLYLYLYPVLLLFLRIPVALLGFYLIVRSKIVDTGPVLSRMVLYVIVVLFVVAGFAVANTFLAQAFHGYAMLVPIEILAALAIGFWVSGLRDVAGWLSLASVDAWSAWARGRPRDERDALTHALRLAERTRQRGAIAEVRAQMAFSAWREGDDDEFGRNAEALTRLLGDRNMRGLRGFALAATSGDESRYNNADLPEWRARVLLLRCARTNDATRAQQYAMDALVSADRAGLASLQLLTLVAVAETHSDQRDVSLDRAHAIARDAGWPALSKSILALRANARDIGILEPFVEVQLRKRRPGRPLFEVSFFNAELSQNGARIALAEKQLELLLTVASVRAGINYTELLDSLWPEADGDAARNSFHVCLHHLRRSAGDPRIVARAGKGYVLHPWADVDLWRLQALISTCRESGGRNGAPELRELCDELLAGEGRRATLGDWFYRFEQVLSRKLDEAERLLDRRAVRKA